MALKNDILDQTRTQIIDRIDPSEDVGEELEQFLQEVADWIDERPWYVRTALGIVKSAVAELAARLFKRVFEAVNTAR